MSEKDTHNKSMRSDLGRVLGLGSARDGVHHWWMQRVTALALIPLTIWFALSLIGMAGAGWEETTAWLSSPLVAIMMMLLVGATFWHAALGIQSVLEDYIHCEALKIILILVVKLGCFALAVTAIFSLLKLAL